MLDSVDESDVALDIAAEFKRRERRERRSAYLAALIVLALVCAAVYFVAIRVKPPRVDAKGIGVADAFTQAAWNQRDCKSAQRYAAAGSPIPQCSSVSLAEWKGVTFRISTHTVVSKCTAGTDAIVGQLGGYAPSNDCVRYSGTGHHTITYNMTKVGGHWRVLFWIGT
jgi:hypothetical protein